MQLAKVNAELTTYQQRISKMRDGPGKTALKQKASKVLQRRKMYESQKDQIEQQSWNMQQAGMMQDNLKSRRILFILFGSVLLVPGVWFYEAIAAAAVVLAVWTLARGVGALLRAVLRKADVMTTVDAMKTTNKELKKQYGQINIDKSRLQSPLLLVHG